MENSTLSNTYLKIEESTSRQTGATYYVNSKVKPSVGSKSPESIAEPKVVVWAIQATPLFVASCNGHFQIVQYLVEKGANISARTSSEADSKFDGLSPLYEAVCDFRSQNSKAEQVIY